MRGLQWSQSAASVVPFYAVLPSGSGARIGTGGRVHSWAGAPASSAPGRIVSPLLRLRCSEVPRYLPRFATSDLAEFPSLAGIARPDWRPLGQCPSHVGLR